tara:strand:+ start:598 stop:792 length:195 start_codon:yes stop_codon:yes gene_type:complete
MKKCISIWVDGDTLDGMNSAMKDTGEGRSDFTRRIINEHLVTTGKRFGKKYIKGGGHAKTKDKV